MYTVKKFSISYVREPGGQSKAIKENRILTNKNDVEEFCKNYLFGMPFEKCICIALGGKNNIIGFMAFDGTVNQAAVYPREIFSFLFSSGAASFILCHNHPGENQTASEADWELTNRIFQIGKLLDIRMLDHIIVADKLISLKENSRWPI